MYDHRIRLFDQIHLMLIDIDAMSEQCLLSKDPAVHQPVHDPLSVMFQTVMQIFDSLCNMDMIADSIRFVGCRQLHRFV